MLEQSRKMSKALIEAREDIGQQIHNVWATGWRIL